MVSLQISQTPGLLRKLQNLLQRSALITIYKAFIRPYLDYGDILYDQACNMSFHQKQYNASLVITGAYEVPLRTTLPRNRYRITSFTTLVQKTENVLQN